MTNDQIDTRAEKVAEEWMIQFKPILSDPEVIKKLIMMGYREGYCDRTIEATEQIRTLNQPFAANQFKS